MLADTTGWLEEMKMRTRLFIYQKQEDRRICKSFSHRSSARRFLILYECWATLSTMSTLHTLIFQSDCTLIHCCQASSTNNLSKKRASHHLTEFKFCSNDCSIIVYYSLSAIMMNVEHFNFFLPCTRSFDLRNPPNVTKRRKYNGYESKRKVRA